ncbi:MAG: hypothetical protein KBT20_07655 [Bacteroidales bacterium]|nr:hypothetical protein [Candidatus Liminaster caballi]
MQKNTRNDFLRNLSIHMTRFLERINPSSLDDTEKIIVSMARTQDEKEQLEAMCEDNRKSRQRLEELRESRKSGLGHGEWLENMVDKELYDVYPEISEHEKQDVKQFLIDRFYEDIEANADALNEELDQTTEIAKGGSHDC